MTIQAEQKILSRNFLADGAVVKYTVVSLSSAASDGRARVATTANSATAPLGVAQETVATGEEVEVMLIGVTLVAANGAYAVGDSLMVAASDGQVDTGTDNAGDNYWRVGLALEAAGAADEHRAMLINIHETQVED